MSEIKASGGRMRAPIDRLLDPSKGRGAGGFLVRDYDTGRQRASALQRVRASVGDFGPLLFFHADDASVSGEGVVTLPNRGSLPVSLVSEGTHPTIGTLGASETHLDGARAIVFVDGADSRLIAEGLDLLPDMIGAECEIILALVRTEGASVNRGVWLNISAAVELGSTDGGLLILTAADGAYSYARQTGGTFDGGTAVAHALDAVTVLSITVRTVGAGAAASLTVDGAQASAQDPSTPSTLVMDWLKTSFTIGGDQSGTFLAAGMNVHAIALYDRILTDAERRSIVQGYKSSNASIYEHPRFDSVAAFADVRTWHPERLPRQVAGVLLDSDDFDNQPASSIEYGRSASGRALGTFGGSGYLRDQEPTFTTAAADSVSFWVAGKRQDGLLFRQAYAPYYSLADAYIAVDALGQVEAKFGGTVQTLTVLGDVEGRNVVAIVTVDQGTGTMVLTAYAWDDGASFEDYDTETVSAACGATPIGSATAQVGGRTGPYWYGELYGAGVAAGVLTSAAKAALFRYFFQGLTP